MCELELSIIIPIYNAEKTIHKCLDSILEQCTESMEIICVDDGSEDDSVNILHAYAENAPIKIHVISLPHNSAGHARNSGLDLAQGRYVHFIDADDYVMSGAYASILPLVLESEADCVKFRCKAFDKGTGQYIKNNIYEMEDMPADLFGTCFSFENHMDLLLKACVTPWSSIYKREFIQRNHIKFDEIRILNDRGFYLDAISSAEKIAFLDVYVMAHFVNNRNSLAGNRYTEEGFSCYAYVMKNMLNRLQSRPVNVRNRILEEELIIFCGEYEILHMEIKDRVYENLMNSFGREYIRTLGNHILRWPLVLKFYTREFSEEIARNLDHNVTDSVDTLCCFLKDHASIILYGAGRCANSLLLFLEQEGISIEKIRCIAVSSKAGNPDQLLGIPVVSVYDIAPKENEAIIVCAFEKFHKEIAVSLLMHSFDNQLFVSDHLYRRLRQETNNIGIDLLNDTYQLRREIKALHQKLQKIEDHLSRMDRCREYGVSLYGECISKTEYEFELKRWYMERTGKVLNLEFPQTFNEKIQWMKLYGITPLMKMLTDKYEVRRYVEEKIGGSYLVPIYGVWDRFTDIDFNCLPERFVLKCTHGSGMNEIVLEKSSMNRKLLESRFERWLSTNYAYRDGLQLQYKDIEPRIIAEEYIENVENELFDYKFWCFHGKVEYIMFLSERNTGLKMDFFDRDWNHQPFSYNYSNSSHRIPKPPCLEEAIRISEILAEGFQHVRVDLYILGDGRIKFGEMTFTSFNGVCRWNPEEMDKKLGRMM